MSLWGNTDNLAVGGVSGNVVIAGTATSEFWTATVTGAENIPTGTAIVLGAGGVGGFAVVEAGISSTVVKVNALSSVPGSYASYSFSQQPISLKNDPGYAETSADGSLDRTQKAAAVSEATNASVSGTIYEVGVGWVGVTTYMDNSHSPALLRVKKEILVAASGITTGGVREYPTDY